MRVFRARKKLILLQQEHTVIPEGLDYINFAALLLWQSNHGNDFSRLFIDTNSDGWCSQIRHQNMTVDQKS